MTKRSLPLGLALFGLACAGDGPAMPSPSSPTASWLEDPDEIASGGAATVFDASRTAFAQAIPGLPPALEDDFFVGNALFNRGWVIAPASVIDMDGLGPIFNATNCSGCHLRDGRGRPPERADEPFSSMLLRLSVPGRDTRGGPSPEPTYGGQLQIATIPGVPVEGVPRVSYEELTGRYADGEPYTLRRPRYAIEALAKGPLADGAMISPRVAPHMVGLGLLEAVDEDELLERADPDDRDGDGISGRANRVWDAVEGRVAIGRFGWKANQANLRQQTAAAFNGDIGITSSLFLDEPCTAAQGECLAAPRGETVPQLRQGFLNAVVTYSATLAVPARRHPARADVQRGKRLFANAGCPACHTPVMRTGSHPAIPQLSHQTIRPFTDLLLHDMGPGLADDRPDFEADGREWRTPPLWGLGLVPVVNRHNLLLHDGRARGFAEAVLWHGGEAEKSRQAFVALSRADRVALVSFLESL